MRSSGTIGPGVRHDFYVYGGIVAEGRGGTGERVEN